MCVCGPVKIAQATMWGSHVPQLDKEVFVSRSIADVRHIHSCAHTDLIYMQYT